MSRTLTEEDSGSEMRGGGVTLWEGGPGWVGGGSRCMLLRSEYALFLLLKLDARDDVFVM